jgi:hypothetical protein
MRDLSRTAALQGETLWRATRVTGVRWFETRPCMQTALVVDDQATVRLLICA